MSDTMVTIDIDYAFTRSRSQRLLQIMRVCEIAVSGGGRTDEADAKRLRRRPREMIANLHGAGGDIHHLRELAASLAWIRDVRCSDVSAHDQLAATRARLAAAPVGTPIAQCGNT
jgi:hypothetical protein